VDFGLDWISEQTPTNTNRTANRQAIIPVVTLATMKGFLMLLPFLVALIEISSIEASSSSNRCFLPSDSGNCYASYSAWYYDTNTEDCEKFTYGGCGGNGNNFDSHEECMNACYGSIQHEDDWDAEQTDLSPSFGPDYHPMEDLNMDQQPHTEIDSPEDPANADFLDLLGPDYHPMEDPNMEYGDCDQPRCVRTMLCPYGYEKGEDGCDTCACNWPHSSY